MAIGIWRRDLLTLIGGATVAWPLAARAQQPALPVIGYLGLAPASSAAFRLAAMRDGLHDLGYSDGNNIAIESRWAEGPDQLREFATELVQHRAAEISNVSYSDYLCRR
jgi:putative ABC transport system substrate-binding protein